MTEYLTLIPLLTIVVLVANSLDQDNTQSISASHLDLTFLTKQIFKAPKVSHYSKTGSQRYKITGEDCKTCKQYKSTSNN